MVQLNVFIAQLSKLHWLDFNWRIFWVLLISSFADFYYQPAPRLNTTYYEDYLRLRLRTTITPFSTKVIVASLWRHVATNLSLCPIMRQRVEHDSCSSEHGGSDLKSLAYASLDLDLKPLPCCSEFLNGSTVSKRHHLATFVFFKPNILPLFVQSLKRSIYRKNWSLIWSVLCKRDKACNCMIARD